ncbi:MAG TPA: Nif3-like dinuclear metal center hexameric protein [Chloroflexota bacterium]|nr:Nif3-like dinuclear metal center hexameric protein [Chloroflexota bacterium]
MRAIDLDRHMRTVGTWVDWDDTVDTFKCGDPQAEVRGVAVAWQSQWPALREAHAAGCNLFVTHEPTFYVHRDDDPGAFGDEQLRAKRAWLAEVGMVVYRCHDVWDVMPEWGVRDSWARGLGLQGPPLAEDARRYYGLYRLEPQPLRELARRLATRVLDVGQDHVQLVDPAGDGARTVARLAIGTGAACRVPAMAALRSPEGAGPDALLVTDDGMRFWADGSWAIDRDLPLLVVNHASAEEWGMRSLAAYLGAQFPSVPVRHLAQGCLYRTIDGAPRPA